MLRGSRKGWAVYGPVQGCRDAATPGIAGGELNHWGQGLEHQMNFGAQGLTPGAGGYPSTREGREHGIGTTCEKASGHSGRIPGTGSGAIGVGDETRAQKVRASVVPNLGTEKVGVSEDAPG